jgi:hypothetical protein
MSIAASNRSRVRWPVMEAWDGRLDPCLPSALSRSCPTSTLVRPVMQAQQAVRHRCLLCRYPLCTTFEGEWSLSVLRAYLDYAGLISQGKRHAGIGTEHVPSLATCTSEHRGGGVGALVAVRVFCLSLGTHHSVTVSQEMSRCHISAIKGALRPPQRKSASGPPCPPKPPWPPAALRRRIADEERHVDPRPRCAVAARRPAPPHRPVSAPRS